MPVKDELNEREEQAIGSSRLWVHVKGPDFDNVGIEMG